MVLDVLAWELRRLRASRSSWAFAAVAFLFCVGLIALKHSWGRPVVDGVTGESIEILGTTSVGVLYLMIAGVLTLFALFLPFVATDSVAHDYQQRVHELVMATPVSSVAYVWGRYLACLLVSIGLDGLLLVAVLVMGAVLHVGQPSYPVPDVGLVLGVWALAILPATVVITSLSFTLGTLLPRFAVFAKLGVLLGWISLEFLADVLDHGGTWFTYWNPTSYGIVRVHVDAFLEAYLASVGGVADVGRRLTIALQLQARSANLWPWVPSHLVLVGVGLLIVAVVAARFPRFRPVMG